MKRAERIKRPLFTSSLVLMLLVACSPTGGATSNGSTLTVFAAASLTDAFNEIGASFSAAQPGVKVVFNFAGSQQLRTQLEQGARADVFASANTKEMNAAIASSLVVSGTQQTFVRNRLIVILPKANPGHIQSLQDLAQPGLKIILAAAGVPVGGYSLVALDKLNGQFGATYSTTVLSNVVSYEDNVKQVVAKIQLGEGDAGLVYSSDVTPAAAPQLQTIDIPDQFNVTATYPIAVLNASPQSELAASFVAYVLSKQGQAILQKWGFIPK
jgi:molybdate transport system substrate-binding protein